MTRHGQGFVRHVQLDPRVGADRYPFNLPVVTCLAGMDSLDLDPAVTFLVGDNGSGKSTLIEALATAAGFNAEGGSRSFRFASRSTESDLGDHLTVCWNRRPRTGFFLRAATCAK